MTTTDSGAGPASAPHGTDVRADALRGESGGHGERPEREAPQPIPPAPWSAIRGELGGVAVGRRLQLGGGVALLALGSGAQLLIPVALGQLVDAAVNDRGTEALLGPAALAGIAVLVGVLASAAGLVCGTRALDVVLAGLRQRLVARSLVLRHTTRERAGAGDIVSRATADIAEVGDSIGTAFPAVTGAAFTFLLTIVGLGVLDPRYLLVLVLVLPIQSLATRAYLRRAPGVYAAERAAMAERAGEVLDSLNGLRTVNAYRIEQQRQHRIADRSWQVVRLSVTARQIQNRFLTGINIAEFAGLAAVLVAGFLLVRAGWGTVGEATTAVLFFLALSGPVGRLLFVIDDVQSAAASLRRIVGVIRYENDHADAFPRQPGPTGPHPARPAGDTDGPSEAPGTVVLRGVTYAFPGREPALRDIDISLSRGERVAIVGTSGAGKSTLAALVSGLLCPERGRVRVSGRVPHALDPGARGRTVALVTQEHHVFAGSLRDDLRLADADADDQRLWEALRAVGVADWARELPDGLDTVVGARGVPPTPARQQQLALARLWLVDPDVVVLDEATAEADGRFSQVLRQALEAVTAGRTTVLVAHRLSQARAADRVIVLDGGRVLQDGGHDELLRAGGLYSALWAAWESGRGSCH